ncbi:MAG: hypothetical protein V4733_03630 [Verrucomicrobiota bacterium]
MPTIAEIIAARKASAETQSAPAGPKAASIAETIEAEAAIDRIDPPGKRKPPTLILSTATSPEVPESRGQATPVNGPPEQRALVGTAGETLDMTPVGADPGTAAWHQAMCGLESELCVMRDPADPEACWLALRPAGKDLPPLLLHRLPWTLWDHPDQQRPPDEPF